MGDHSLNPSPPNLRTLKNVVPPTKIIVAAMEPSLSGWEEDLDRRRNISAQLAAMEPSFNPEFRSSWVFRDAG